MKAPPNRGEVGPYAHNPGWDAQAKHCPCTSCGQFARCAREHVSCKAWRQWVLTGKSVRHVDRVPDQPLRISFETHEE